MRILIIPSWYPTQRKTLLGCFFQEQAMALAERGHEVCVFPLYVKGKDVPLDTPPCGGSYAEKPVFYRRLPLHLTYFSVVLGLVREMHSHYRGMKPDIIHVHSFRAAKYARALKLLFGVPYIITEHSTWFERGKLSKRQKKEASKAFNCASAVIAVSSGLRNVIAPLCRKEVRVVPNMVEERFFGALREELPVRPFRFISVAFLRQKKGIDVLLRAFVKVREEYPGTELTICGNGDQQETLQQLSHELKLDDCVTFTGRVSREECAANLRRSHAFVLPSRHETFGIVYVEAMACGLPIVMTKTNAWEMLAMPETGLAVSIDDEAALAEAMGRMIRDFARYDARTVSEYCRDRFSADAVCRDITAVYQSVVNPD